MTHPELHHRVSGRPILVSVPLLIGQKHFRNIQMTDSNVRYGSLEKLTTFFLMAIYCVSSK